MLPRRLALLSLLLLVTAGSVTAATKPLSFTVFAKTGLPLGDVAWTGERFLYVAERTGEITASGPSGNGLALFASLPAEYEEVRCVPSPGDHGWAAGDVYCHGPRGEIWRVGADGSTSSFVTLPDTKLQDGALAFDSGGGFRYALLAASGGSGHNGGNVYALTPDGGVRRVGGYPGPGGAENLELAPAGFGTASGELLLAIDARSKGGRLLAIAPGGSIRRLVTFPHGINPIVVIGRGDAPRGAAPSGLYLTDTLTKDVYFAAASQLALYGGAVMVGSEKGLARFWLVRPSGRGFAALRLHSSLERLRSSWNLEGAIYVQ